ncbi:MAG TPA: lipopolysaccharide heptosyltransferase I [Tepidisphaeraceae bacterium]|nr:lipopolysaccharide heptosyltransferase I [Tepidisphaeraceae bacterium]
MNLISLKDSSYSPRRVLIIKPSAIGDIVHALPVLPRLRQRWPEAKLSWLVTPAYADLVKRHPLLDEVILFERRRFGHGWHNPAALWDLGGFVRQLRKSEFDLVIDLQGLFRSAWIAAASGAPRRVGFSNAREFAPMFYTDLVDCSWELDHAVERYLKIAAALGCAEGPVEFCFAVDDEDRRYIEQLIPAGMDFAVLLPGTNWATKQWPVERFAELVGPLKERFGLDSVAAGAAGDAKLTRRIPAQFDLTGRTNLRQMVALLERASLVVGNDTGPMHVAAALRVPLVTPYGPTDPGRTGPFRRENSVVRLNLPCSPCYSRTCSHHSCMQWLEMDAVLTVAREQIGRR